MHVSLCSALVRPAVLLALIAPFGIAPAVQAQELKPIELPKPQISGGMPLMEALAHRQTTRAFAAQPMPVQTLSNLLWAAFGVNRPRDAKPGLGRTAPSAMNRQEVELYVLLPQGIYVYEAEANRLRPIAAGDVRARISPEAAAQAAVTLVYVADAKNESAQVDVGFIGQNVYLFAASEGLNGWFYAIHNAETAATLKLPEGRKALYMESVGYPPAK